MGPNGLPVPLSSSLCKDTPNRFIATGFRSGNGFLELEFVGCGATVGVGIIHVGAFAGRGNAQHLDNIGFSPKD